MICCYPSSIYKSAAALLRSTAITHSAAWCPVQMLTSRRGAGSPFVEGACADAGFPGRALGFLAMLGLNSFLAFFVNLTNFLVTKHTSALTLQARPALAHWAA